MVDPLNLAYLFPTVHTHPNPPTRPTHQDERQKKGSSSSKRPNWISIRKREVSQSLRASRSTGVLKGSGRLMLGSVFISLSLSLSLFRCAWCSRNHLFLWIISDLGRSGDLNTNQGRIYVLSTAIVVSPALPPPPSPPSLRSLVVSEGIGD